MKLAIRADASLSIGSGHVMRCLTLAEEFKARGGEVLFICRAHEGHLAETIGTRGVRVVCLPAPLDGLSLGGSYGDWLGVDPVTDARQTLAAMDERDFRPDWLVVDHYGLGADWETTMRRVARRIMVIDDLADRPHDCDLLLDQNWIADFETRYHALTPASSRRLLGPAYALLQRPYRDLAARAVIRSGVPRRVLVYFGATDAAGLTLSTLEAFLSLSREDVTADIVVGTGNADRDAILAKAEGRANVNVYLSLPSLADLMLAADHAVGASGTTSWERICLKLPALVVTLADNQRAIAAEIDRLGLARWLGDAVNVDRAVLGSALRDNLGPAGASWFDARLASTVDGRGAERVVDALVAVREEAVSPG
jgi:UDP-2,4-diacetamido-2,4,6-trideoxy-beta-L-altropyranose hydrolase